MVNSVELLIFKLHSQKINNEIPILSRSIYQGLIDKYKPILEKNKKKLILFIYYFNYISKRSLKSFNILKII